MMSWKKTLHVLLKKKHSDIPKKLISPFFQAPIGSLTHMLTAEDFDPGFDYSYKVSKKMLLQKKYIQKKC
jgi:hypothetical protein